LQVWRPEAAGDQGETICFRVIMLFALLIEH
jgi:hypothetical protein